MNEGHIYDLDQEMDTLRVLTERTPRGEELLTRGSTVDGDGERRNDAVVGQSRFSVLSKDNRDMEGFTLSGGFPERLEDNRGSNRQFVSVDDLPLVSGDPIQR